VHLAGHVSHREIAQGQGTGHGAIALQREMLLKIVSDDEAVIKPEDIHYYDERPKNAVASIKGHAIDLAISQKEGADYTANRFR
jgi:hypothetical protein